VAALIVTAWPTAWGQVLVIVVAGLVGLRLLPGSGDAGAPHARVPFGRPLGLAALALFFALLVALPILRYLTGSPALAVFDGFYRAGALVFGGGHVVLPLLQAEVVPPGWVSNEQFLAGYGAAQAVPGPLFTLAAYLGAVMRSWPNGWLGGLIALVGIFLPGALLLIGTLPFWDALRARPAFRAALRGINAAVVGLLLAALYQPVWTSAIHAPADFALALAAFGLLTLWGAPPWLVVAFCAAGGQAIARLR
jgi:chromate transporter